jgi:hypothetical protein
VKNQPPGFLYLEASNRIFPTELEMEKLPSQKGSNHESYRLSQKIGVHWLPSWKQWKVSGLGEEVPPGVCRIRDVRLSSFSEYLQGSIIAVMPRRRSKIMPFDGKFIFCLTSPSLLSFPQQHLSNFVLHLL